jgi:hypothetical protein
MCRQLVLEFRRLDDEFLLRVLVHRIDGDPFPGNLRIIDLNEEHFLKENMRKQVQARTVADLELSIVFGTPSGYIPRVFHLSVVFR